MDSYEKGDELSDYDVPNEFLCPSDRISKYTVHALRRVLCSYGYNYTEWKPQGGWKPPIDYYAGNWTDRIKRPSEKLAFVDSVDWWVWWNAADYRIGWDKVGQASILTYKNLNPSVDGPVIYRHSEGANIAFYDVHVEYLKKEKIFVIEDFEADPKKPGMWVADLLFYRKYHSN